MIYSFGAATMAAQFAARSRRRGEKKKIHSCETDAADRRLSLTTKLRCDFSLPSLLILIDEQRGARSEAAIDLAISSRQGRAFICRESLRINDYFRIQRVIASFIAAHESLIPSLVAPRIRRRGRLCLRTNESFLRLSAFVMRFSWRHSRTRPT